MYNDLRPALRFNQLRIKGNWPLQSIEVTGTITNTAGRALPFEELHAIIRKALDLDFSFNAMRRFLVSVEISPGIHKLCIPMGHSASFSMKIPVRQDSIRDGSRRPYGEPFVNQPELCSGLEELPDLLGTARLLRTIPHGFLPSFDVELRTFRSYVAEALRFESEAARDAERVALELTNISVHLRLLRTVPWSGGDAVYADLIVNGKVRNVFNGPVSLDSFPYLTDGVVRSSCAGPHLSHGVASTQVSPGIWKYSLLTGVLPSFEYMVGGVQFLNSLGPLGETKYEIGRWRLETEDRYDGMPCRFTASEDVTALVNDAVRNFVSETLASNSGWSDSTPSVRFSDRMVGMLEGGIYYVAVSDKAYAVHTSPNCPNLARSQVMHIVLSDEEAQRSYFCPNCSYWSRTTLFM